MWLFTAFGFFSIVRKTDDTQLTLRSRTRGDLLRLRQHYLPQASEPESHAGTDYPWRMRCTDEDLAQALPNLVRNIDYANFKDEVAQVTGKARAKRYSQVWSALYGQAEDLPEPHPDDWLGLPWPQKAAVGKPRAFGGVVVDPTGRLLLREVAGHYDGYVWSFAKGRPDAGESPRQVALREVREELGVDARILLPLPGTFAGTTTRSHFFLMTVDPGTVRLDYTSRETSRLCWALPDEARRLISLTTHPIGRERDLAVLEAALQALPSPLPLQRPIARREDWSTRPLPAHRQELGYRRTFSAAEMAKVARGFIPTVQEQKWFACFEDGTLDLYRSWTGYAIFRLHLEPVPKKAGAAAGSWTVVRAEVNRHAGQYHPSRDEEDVRLLGDLVEQMLIGYGEEPAVDGLELALITASQPNYLGSPAVVQELVQPCIQAMVDGLSGAARGTGEDRHDRLEAALARLTRAMTDDPAYTRIPWHSREQLGEALIRLMSLDGRACEGSDLAFVIGQAMAAVQVAATSLWTSLHRQAQTPWEPDGANAFGRLTGFVVSAFLGTASVVHPGLRVEDFAGIQQAPPMSH